MVSGGCYDGLVQMGGSGRETLSVGGGAEAVVGFETAGEAALVGPADRAPDAGDRLVGVQEQDGGVLGAELAQVGHGGQPGSSIEQPDQVARSEMQLGRQAGQRPVPGDVG